MRGAYNYKCLSKLKENSREITFKKQKSNYLVSSLKASYVQWIFTLSLSLQSVLRKLLIVNYKQFAYLKETFAATQLQGCAAVSILQSGIYTALNQNVNNAQVAKLGRQMQSIVHVGI